MFDLEQELIEIIKNNSIKTALDLWAWSGIRTKFLADNGAQTVAVDNQSMPIRQFDQSLLLNPNITFISQNIEEYIQQTNQTFDLVLLLNVIVFIPKPIFLETILPKIIDVINKGWYLVFSFFFSDDQTMQSPKSHFYTFEDFDILNKDFEITHKENIRTEDNHKPHGVHQHHIGYLIVKKK